MTDLKKYHREVTDKLHAAKAGDKPNLYPDLQKYIGTRYEFVGLSVPRQRQVFKAGFSHSTLSLPEQLAIWDALWRDSPLYEVLSQVLLFTSHHLELFDAALLWETTRGWVGKIDNWAHSDSLSAIYSYLLEKELEEHAINVPAKKSGKTAVKGSSKKSSPVSQKSSPVYNQLKVYSQLKSWNSSANPWERRQSVVSLLEYDKKRKTVLPAGELLSMVEPLLRDEDYFVQKGVGWTLREIGNRHPAAAWQFLLDHATAIRPPAFTAAIEKLTPAKKERLKKLRKRK
jgi:3-methyladenine DNA glycosylase AlkD